jgi:hypothetical protein
MTIAQNTTICVQPAKLMAASEFFGFQQGVDEIDRQKHGHAAREDEFEQHVRPHSRSQA